MAEAYTYLYSVENSSFKDLGNLIAHNSYIGDTERNLIKTYYNVILKQISETSN